jgi:hypothetical protein
MKVEVGLINRVFLSSAIETRLLRSQEVEAHTGKHSQTLASAKKPLGTVPEPLGKDADRAAGNASADSDTADEKDDFAVLFDGKPIDRPVAFAFESVRYTPPVNGSAKTCVDP